MQECLCVCMYWIDFSKDAEGECVRCSHPGLTKARACGNSCYASGSGSRFSVQ